MLFSLTSCQWNVFNGDDTSSSFDSSFSSSEVSSSTSEPWLNSEWGRTLGKILYDTLGDDIPFVYGCNSFDYESGKNTIGKSYVNIYCYFDDSIVLEESPATYSALCESVGYAITYEQQRYVDPSTLIVSFFDIYYARRELTSTTGIYLNFTLATHNGNRSLAIRAETYVPDSAEE